jgi:hypothetical protein
MLLVVASHTKSLQVVGIHERASVRDRYDMVYNLSCGDYSVPFALLA